MSGEAGGCKCGCGGGSAPVLVMPTSAVPAERRVLDVRGLEPPEPFDRTLQALDVLPAGVALEQFVDRVPVFLFPELERRGLAYTVDEVGDWVTLLIWAPGPGEAAVGLAAGEPAQPADDGIRTGPDGETVLDVRVLGRGQKHPAIFGLYDRLAPGESFVLLNDHNPKPLRFQFDAQRPGAFTWEYLEEGPVDWRVRIGRR